MKKKNLTNADLLKLHYKFDNDENAGEAIKKELSWDKVIKPLHEFCKTPKVNKKNKMTLGFPIPPVIKTTAIRS